MVSSMRPTLQAALITLCKGRAHSTPRPPTDISSKSICMYVCMREIFTFVFGLIYENNLKIFVYKCMYVAVGFLIITYTCTMH